MDRLSIIMVRSALIWLILVITIGGLMLADRAIPGDSRVWLAPSHGHILFVGWFLQFALGIAYWLLPRKRTESLPLGYRELTGVLATVALNVGLALRVVAEPFERTGHASDLTLTALGASSLLQVGAVVGYVAQLWPRVYGRNRLGASSGRSRSASKSNA